MQIRTAEKEKAITLRREGRTYSEILKIIPVAKSTLSLWLREVGLAKEQKQRITEKRILGQKKGARRKREIRQILQQEIYRKSASEVGNISNRELWLIGIALYWAEGAKQKEYYPVPALIFQILTIG